jgi:3-oxoacyl-[acyl-carrier-protein] synthase III
MSSSAAPTGMLHGRRVPRPYPVRILGTGVHRPLRVVDSAELDTTYSRPSGTTLARSGVGSRRWAGPDETSSTMGAQALRAALSGARLEPGDLDAVIVASVCPEQPMPTNAVLILRELGLGHGRAEGFDVNASCLGFLTALEVASFGVTLGQWDRVGIVATELASKGLNHAEVECSALFGDGAGAAVVARARDGDGSRVLAMRFATWPEGAGFCRIDAGGTRWNTVTPPADPTAFLFTMDGQGVLKHAAARLPGFLEDLLGDLGMSLGQLDVVVPHQASGVGLRYLREKLGFPAHKVIDVLADHGNQVSASIPNALHEAVASGRLRRGGTALILGTAAGLTIGAAVVTY